MHILITTTDKVYKNQSLKKSFSEKDTLGGNDPYSASKAALEVICDYYNYKLKNNNKILNIARSGNVIGGGDFSKDRIFPDIYKSIKNKTTLSIRNPNSVRPWQHVLEPLYGYLRIVEKSNKTRLKSNAFNFGPHNNQSISVKEILKITQTFYPRLKYQIKAKQEFYESSYLFLNSALVKKYIFYEQIWNINKTVSKTINWYLDFLKKKDVLKISIQDINDFEKNF